VTNAGTSSVLLLAITAAPHLPGAFRVRCDHLGLVRHPGEDRRRQRCCELPERAPRDPDVHRTTHVCTVIIQVETQL
jgi:hypothetical protein